MSEYADDLVNLGLSTTCYAEEVDQASNVQIALDEMELERIGHVYHVFDH